MNIFYIISLLAKSVALHMSETKEGNVNCEIMISYFMKKYLGPYGDIIERYTILFYGSDFIWVDIIAIVMINFVLQQNFINGKAKKYLQEVEDPSRCMVRMLTNYGFTNLYNDIVKEKLHRFKYLTKFIESYFKYKIDSEKFILLKANLKEELGSLKGLADKYLNKFRLAGFQLAISVKDNIYSVDHKKLRSFFFRNFSTKMMKSGIYLRNYILAINIVLMLAIF